MNLTNEKEKIKQWVEQNKIDNGEWKTFPGEENTYWKQRKTTAGIEEYDFSTIRDVKEKLHNQWKEEEMFQEIEQVLSVAALKVKEKEETEAELPVYVYVF